MFRSMILSVAVLLAPMVVSAVDLPTYKKIFEDELLGIVLEYGMKLSEAAESYTKSLKSLSEKVMSAGDLTKS